MDCFIFAPQVRLLLHQAKPSPTRKAALPTAALLERYKCVPLVTSY
jgi:hypothetical protein